jgi:lysophospholipase L1-like esterase
VTAPATSSAGASVHYPLPAASGGQAPIATTCTPGAGHAFPIGTTPVTCTTTDAAATSVSCSFPVIVTPPPELARTNFMAFGDSITAGEVTVPSALRLLDHDTPVYRQVVVPGAAYPTVLERLLMSRYVGQQPQVVNEGRPGESAGDAEPRLLRALEVDRPDAVLLLMGYNDLSSSARRIRVVATMERMAKDVRGYGARLFLATLTPPVPGRQRSIETSAIVAYNDDIRTLAAGEGAVLVDLYEAMLPNASAWIGVDGLHPTEAGYAFIAEAFFAAVRADLERR